MNKLAKMQVRSAIRSTTMSLSRHRIDHARTPATVAAAPGHGQKPVRHLTMEHVTERWLPVVGYEGYYEISSLGRIRSIERVIVAADGHSWTHQGQIRKTQFNVYGYPALTLFKGKRGGNRGKSRTVHVLVCEAFHGLRPDGYEARHLNGDQTDNRAENLTWGTHSENVLDQVRHGTHRYAKTHCKWGHEYTLENTDASRGYNLCLTCRKRRNRESMLRGIERRRVAREAREAEIAATRRAEIKARGCLCADGLSADCPVGLCQCGCGEVTALSTRNRFDRGILRGEHMPFIQGGHARRLDAPSTINGHPMPGPHWQRIAAADKAAGNNQ